MNNTDNNWYQSIETEPDYLSWLSTSIFPENGFNSSFFQATKILYHIKIQDSLLEEVVHRGISPSGFTKSELNNAILHATKECYGHADTKWFHVNIHDGIARVVEKFGKYRFRCPLVPIYIILNHHQADEGGQTYAGIASARKEWLLLFDSGELISVHGSSEFVDLVYSNLNVKN